MNDETNLIQHFQIPFLRHTETCCRDRIWDELSEKSPKVTPQSYSLCYKEEATMGARRLPPQLLAPVPSVSAEICTSKKTVLLHVPR
ncbi:hypothetical protein P7K49_005134 [Saguinus oedipus]|uniref:Uncharacterized protein n=1 Tax=Saguinus oedipus TaxID=9490 RepID=A0ABQ9W9D5_SAGOE|nr:hypothetical protein P7K49_005134 [Saguinus oedipus]